MDLNKIPVNLYAETQMDLKDKYISQLLATIELIRRGNIDGEKFSNHSFGWQSSGLPQSGTFLPFIQKLNDKCIEFCNSIENFKFTDLTIKKFWANINYENDINWPHKHQDDLSGVFYLQVPENSGDLVLQNLNYDINNKISFHLQNSSIIVIKPIKNKLILFDSNCTHLVTKNNSKQPRISISFNISIND
tara:strand:+ start:1071 stop:1643 length:573 start_codon:yes stop_codon:yes gene_type:complete